jgi:hypothetical protein
LHGALHQDGLAAFREEEMILRYLDERDAIPTRLGCQADALAAHGDLSGALRLAEEAVWLAREVGAKSSVEWLLPLLDSLRNGA